MDLHLTEMNELQYMLYEYGFVSVVEAWDTIAASYTTQVAGFTGAFGPDLLQAVNIPREEGEQSCVVLDVATGSGPVALVAACMSGVSRVDACDLSPNMIAELNKATTALPGTAAPIQTKVCDAAALPYVRAKTIKASTIYRALSMCTSD